MPYALKGNTICGSLEADIQGGPKALSGQDNTCGKAKGWQDKGAKGCAKACP